MILFQEEHVQPILDGHKTQTRRLGKKRWNVGAVHQCKLNYLRGAPPDTAGRGLRAGERREGLAEAFGPA